MTQIKVDAVKIEGRFREEVGDVSDLVESIREKGFLSAIIIDSKNNLIAGERRLVAASKAGLESVPAIIYEAKNEIDAREIELIENVVRKDFTWDERANLEKYIMDLKKEQDPSWTMEKQAEFLGHSKGAVQRRITLASVLEVAPELADCSTEDEAWKKYKRLEEEIVTASLRDKDEQSYKTAIKYAEDHYKIGDALEEIKKVNKGVVHFAEVDPPYAVDLKKVKGRVKDLKKLDRYNEVAVKDYPEFVQDIATEVFRILKDNSFCVWWYGHRWYSEVLAILREVGFKVSEVPAIWVKTSIAGQTASPDTMLGSGYECFFVCRKGSAKLSKPGRSNVFSFEPVPPQDKIHPTERPLELMLEILDTFSHPGTIMCSPFLGSGVTLRAIYLRDSTGFGWELDEMCKERFLNAVYRDKGKEENE